MLPAAPGSVTGCGGVPVADPPARNCCRAARSMGIAGDNLHFERRQCGASGDGYRSGRIRWARESGRRTRLGVSTGASILRLWLVWRLPRKAGPELAWSRESFRPAGRIPHPAHLGTRNHDRARARRPTPAEADRATPPSISAVWDLRAHVLPESARRAWSAFCRDGIQIRHGGNRALPGRLAHPLVCLESNIKASKRCDLTDSKGL